MKNTQIQSTNEKSKTIHRVPEIKMLQLIKKYSDARDKVYYNGSESDYWKGVMHTLHNTLNAIFPTWAKDNSIGHYVFMEMMTYKEAMKKILDQLKETA